jgi:predicted anti-sigma-YlaC factor YlaD
LDGELSQKEKQLVSRHLKDCAVCRKEYEVLKSLDNLLCGFNPIEPSSDFNQRFWKKVDARAAKKTPWSMLKGFSWGWHPSLVSAAAVMLIVSGSFFFYRFVPTTHNSSVPDPMDQLIAQNMTLYSDYEIIENLDLLENWDEIMTMEEQLN